MHWVEGANSGENVCNGLLLVFFRHGGGEWADTTVSVKDTCYRPHRVFLVSHLCGWPECVAQEKYELTINITTRKLFFNKSVPLSFFYNTHVIWHWNKMQMLLWLAYSLLCFSKTPSHMVCLISEKWLVVYVIQTEQIDFTVSKVDDELYVGEKSLSWLNTWK